MRISFCRTSPTWWCGQRLEVNSCSDTPTTFGDSARVAPGSAFRPLSKGATVVSELEPAVRLPLVEDIGIRGVRLRRAGNRQSVDGPGVGKWTAGAAPDPIPGLCRADAGRLDGMPGAWSVRPTAPMRGAVTMQQGARSADVCVYPMGRWSSRTLCRLRARAAIKRSIGACPSRAADNLFWLARYLERAEATVRVVRTLAGRMADHGSGHTRDITLLADLLFKWGAIPAIPSASAMTVAAASALYASPLRCNVPALVANGPPSRFRHSRSLSA